MPSDGAAAAQDDALDPVQRFLAGIAQIGQRAGHGVHAVAAGQLPVVQQVLPDAPLRRSIGRDGRHGRILVAEGGRFERRVAAERECEDPSDSRA